MKTAELLPPELDYWVAKAEGYKQTHPYRWVDSNGNTITDGIPWQPSTNPSQGHPLIEKYADEILLEQDDPKIWAVWIAGDSKVEGCLGHGHTILIAAMRAIVNMRYGGNVDE